MDRDLDYDITAFDMAEGIEPTSILCSWVEGGGVATGASEEKTEAMPDKRILKQSGDDNE